MRLTLLLIASFGGVVFFKEIPSPWLRHGALAAWFVLHAFLMGRFGGAKLNAEAVPFVTWLGKPQSIFGATIVTLYATVSVLMFTLGDSDNQWQRLFSALPFSTDTLWALLLTSVFVPLYEEFYFRAALLPAQISRQAGHPGFGCGGASFFSLYMNALIFWLFHMPTDGEVLWNALRNGAVPIALGPFLLGLACAVVTARDRSLWAAVVLHGFANAAGPLWEGVLLRAGLFDAFYF